jgi:hypothetical protein
MVVVQEQEDPHFHLSATAVHPFIGRSALPRWSLVVLALAAALGLARPASAYTYGDTLTLIWKPLPNLPAFARPGDTFTVWANAPSSASGWDAMLRLGSQSHPLTLAGGGWQSSLARWVMSFQVPAGVPEELYDLTLTCGTCGQDTARHAVKVLPDYPADFYFAQISDSHLPSPVFSSSGSFNPADTSSMADLGPVIEDLNLLHPAFVIHTGDLVNEGELEEYLGMYEMGRAKEMLYRFRDPVFLSSGNHDIGGWKATLPPDGTSRRNWWRYFGWPFLLNPPAGDPYHSQDYSFDYGLLHVIGMEAYLNSGSYDSFMQNIWGTKSFTPEQMGWLSADIAAVPAGRSKLAFYHYDFTGSQINPSTLGLDGVIYGHTHTWNQGNLTARPFNLAVGATSDGARTFRVFRVHNGVITPGPMHHSGGTSTAPTDSLAIFWSGPNDGTQSRLSATVNNRFRETWDNAQLVFVLADHDSSFSATGGTVRQTLRGGGLVRVYVDCVLPASGVATVAVAPLAPLGPLAVEPPRPAAFRLDPPSPNPFVPRSGALSIRFSLPAAGDVRLAVYDLEGRRVATPFDGPASAGGHAIAWDGWSDGGAPLGAGLYFVRLATPAGAMHRKVTVMD